MNRLSLARDRRGTAAIEFALILPVMMLLGVGLVDTVLRNLLMMDVEMAADVGARMALRVGATPHQVADAMTELGVAGLEPRMTVFKCGSTQTDDKNHKNNDQKHEEKVIRKDQTDNKKLESNDLGLNGNESCNILPYGQYIRINAVARSKSLFGSSRSTTITTVAYVRLP
ncbi:MAG: pilus assembly protein [Sandarakinorhabdus sp.]|nr:pilus assembly protein [Sandarakinorhabdus sp.]